MLGFYQLESETMSLTITGPGIRVYQALAVAKGLEFYAQHKVKINRAYSPRNMLRVVTAITGKTFKRNQLAEAAQALRDWAGTQ
jgi:hypothetical protein